MPAFGFSLTGWEADKMVADNLLEIANMMLDPHRAICCQILTCNKYGYRQKKTLSRHQ